MSSSPLPSHIADLPRDEAAVESSITPQVSQHTPSSPANTPLESPAESQLAGESEVAAPVEDTHSEYAETNPAQPLPAPPSQASAGQHTASTPAASSVWFPRPSGTARRLTSRGNLESQANASNAGHAGSAELPPVPYLPKALRRAPSAQASRNNGADTSETQGGSGSGVPQSAAGSSSTLTGRLQKAANPDAPSQLTHPNVIHSLGLSKKPRVGTMDALIHHATPESLGQSTAAQDHNGNTPIHLTPREQGLKIDAGGDPGREQRLKNMRDRTVMPPQKRGTT